MPRTDRAKDEFTARPIAIAVYLWLATIVGSSLSQSIALLMWVAILVAVPVHLASLAVRGHWKRTYSILGAAALLLASRWLAGDVATQLQWQLVRPYYVAKFASLTPAERENLPIPWAGGSGWSVTLRYYESEADAPKWERQPIVPADGCHVIAAPLDSNFYLRRWSC